MAFAWDITNMAYTLATTLLALPFTGIAMSNHSCPRPILPRPLGTRIPAVIDLAGAGVLFIDARPWSPASVGYLLPTATPIRLDQGDQRVPATQTPRQPAVRCLPGRVAPA